MCPTCKTYITKDKKHGYNNYYYYPQMASYTDHSWDSKKQRTKEELFTYYKAPNYFNKKGYKSIVYGKTYYDGYGFNYYNGNYGYYAYSRPPL